jgi:hypothetical protein
VMCAKRPILERPVRRTIRTAFRFSLLHMMLRQG